jgi:hypothetical protein
MGSGSRVRRKLIVALCLAVVVLAGLLAYLFGLVGGSARDPVRLLVTRPALPAVWFDEYHGEAATPISWRRWHGRTTERAECDLGRGAIRGWSDGGDVFAAPKAVQEVCVFRSRFVAWAVYKWQSLQRVASEDWPNFEPYSDAPTAPTQVSALDGLRADQWELGCGLGDPDGLCGVWVFRARYDQVLIVVGLRTIHVGLRFNAFRRFVRSVDRDLSAKMR